MKTLISWSVALALAVGLGLLLRYREGMVSIVLPPHRFDIAANTAALALIGGFIGLYLLTRVALQVIRAPGSLRSWRRARQTRQGHESLSQALLALNEGRSDQVEKLAAVALKQPETAGAATLLVARAADRQGDEVGRDRWLHALKAYPALADARLMFLAESYVERADTDAALTALNELSAKTSKSGHAMRLRLRALEQAGRWEQVLEVATRLRKQNGLSEQAANAVRVNAYESLFEESVTVPGRVEQLFKSLSKQDRNDQAIMVAAITAFAQSGLERRAFVMIEKFVASQIEPSLLVLFTRLGTIKHSERLRVAEHWLELHPDNALVLATLGRLCLAERLWGKAEEFLKRADEQEPSPFTRLALAEMYDAIGRGPEATSLYRSLANERPAMLSLATGGGGAVGKRTAELPDDPALNAGTPVA